MCWVHPLISKGEADRIFSHRILEIGAQNIEERFLQVGDTHRVMVLLVGLCNRAEETKGVSCLPHAMLPKNGVLARPHQYSLCGVKGFLESPGLESDDR